MANPAIDMLLTKYLLQPGDAELRPAESPPIIYSGCRVTPLIDGETYFHELKAELSQIGNGSVAENAEQFVFVSGWWLDLLGDRVDPPQPLTLDGPGTSDPWMRDAQELLDVLKEKAQRGVDVRVLGFVNYSVMGFNEQTWLPTLTKIFSKALAERVAQIYSNFAGAISQYEDTADSIENLRRGQVKCCLNIIGHAVGGVHNKMWVMGDPRRAVGFTGGMDLRFDRYDNPAHTISKTAGWRDLVRIGWHDVVSKVEGPVVQDFHDFFRQMWNEVVEHRPVKNYCVPARPVWGSQTVVSSTDTIAPRDLNASANPPLDAAGQPVDHHVQSLRTVPVIKYEGRWGFVAKRLGGRPLSFAPDGTFTIQEGWQKAIAAAETYIYMEDWGFWSQDVMVWINDSMQRHANLKVILVKGLKDPNDEDDMHLVQDDLMTLALQKLVVGLSVQDKTRIRVLYRDDVQVHSKSTLIDDRWTIIGSAPCTRRGLYTDLEHSIAVVDADGGLVSAYRTALWTGHFLQACPTDVDAALAIWFGSHGLRTNIKALPIDPLPPVAAQAVGPEVWSGFQRKVDLVFDADSRQPWGKFSLKDLR